MKLYVLLLSALFLIDFELNAVVDGPNLSDPIVILSYSNKNAIALPGSTTKNSAKVISWKFNLNEDQRWHLKKSDKGYLIVSNYSKQVLAVKILNTPHKQ